MLKLFLMLSNPQPLSRKEREDMVKGLIGDMPPLPDIMIIRAMLLSEQLSDEELRTTVRGIIGKMLPTEQNTPIVMMVRVLMFSEELSSEDLQTLALWLENLHEKATATHSSIKELFKENLYQNLVLTALLLPNRLSVDDLKTLAEELILRMDATTKNKPEVMAVRMLLLREEVCVKDIQTLVEELISRIVPSTEQYIDCLLFKSLVLSSDLSYDDMTRFVEWSIKSLQEANQSLDDDEVKEAKVTQKHHVKKCVTTNEASDDAKLSSSQKKRRGRPPKNKVSLSETLIETSTPNEKFDVSSENARTKSKKKSTLSSDEEPVEKAEVGVDSTQEDNTLPNPETAQVSSDEMAENLALSSDEEPVEKAEVGVDATQEDNTLPNPETAQVSSDETAENPVLPSESEATGDTPPKKRRGGRKSPKSRKTFFREIKDFPELEKLADKEMRFSYDYVYRTKHKQYVLSPWVLTSQKPVGIYIPYEMNRFKGKYAGFIVNIYDEDSYKDIYEAISYLKKENEDLPWWIMHTTQYDIIMNFRNMLNKMIEAVGGHILKPNGRYCQVNVQHTDRVSSNKGDIRLTCEVISED